MSLVHWCSQQAPSSTGFGHHSTDATYTNLAAFWEGGLKTVLAEIAGSRSL